MFRDKLASENEDQKDDGGAYHVDGEFAALVEDARAHDLRKTLPAVERELVAVGVDGLLASEPLTERDGWR